MPLPHYSGCVYGNVADMYAEQMAFGLCKWHGMLWVMLYGQKNATHTLTFASKSGIKQHRIAFT